MVTAILAVHALWLHQAPSPARWFGPATATFEVQFGGNPYDPDENDVRVLFVPEKGAAIERMAYYDGVEGAYRAVLVGPQPGEYKAILVRNGHQVEHDPTEGKIVLKDSLKHGFVHVDSTTRTRFKWDDGTPYYPLGNNLGWQNDGATKLTDELDKMAAAGENWTRIWACQWDGKNPWWPSDAEGVAGQLWTPALERWAQLIAACEKNGIQTQMVLFHHGAFSSKQNPNWQDMPWNAKNGGFLKSAADFFTDAEAKRRAKIWLRYAVSRWGASPSLLSWELFNEVEWTDASYANRWPDIIAWHKEMADYIRSIDPYKHPITTSSAVDRSGLWAAMDYVQPHTYPVDIAKTVAAQAMPADKPLFFGEFGGHGEFDARKALRDGIYASVFSGQSGAAQWWDWDVLDKDDLYGEYKIAADVLRRADIAGRMPVHRIVLNVSPGFSAEACTETNMTLIRLQGVPGASVTLSGLPTPDGTAKLQITDLGTGATTSATSLVSKGVLKGLAIPAGDVIVLVGS